MIYTELTKKALKLSFEAHKNQVDKSGMPYVYHPFHLAEQMETEDTVIVALLHDVVEDTDYTLEDIRAMGFPEQVIEALALMTHDKSVPYMDYVAKIKNNPIAKAVKLADLKHNSDLSRLTVVDEKAIIRNNEYRNAIKFLLGIYEIHGKPSVWIYIYGWDYLFTIEDDGFSVWHAVTMKDRDYGSDVRLHLNRDYFEFHSIYEFYDMVGNQQMKPIAFRKGYRNQQKEIECLLEILKYMGVIKTIDD